MLEISKRLAKVIYDSNKSYADLEKETNIAKSSIQRYATGKTKKIPIDAVEKIANATNSSASWIMGWSQQSEKKNDAITDIILKLRTDNDYLEVVSMLKGLSSEELIAVRTFLSAFKQQ